MPASCACLSEHRKTLWLCSLTSHTGDGPRKAGEWAVRSPLLEILAQPGLYSGHSTGTLQDHTCKTQSLPEKPRPVLALPRTTA